MPGFMPGIHVFLVHAVYKDLDGRNNGIPADNFGWVARSG
jgi:hypothetical protein